jgi:hypothetical protein
VDAEYVLISLPVEGEWMPAPVSLGHGTSFSQLLNLSDGSYSLTVYAEDEAGHTSSQTVNFTVDTTPPVITITSPEEGMLYRIALLSLTVSEPSHIWYVVGNYTSPEVVGTSLNVILSLSDGNHTLIVYARDTAGNLGTATVNFSTDSTPPVITILSPEEGVVYDTSEVELNLSVNEDVRLRYVLDGISRPWVEVSDTFTDILHVGDGNHTLIVYARDTAGNLGTATVNFSVSVPKPDLRVELFGEIYSGTGPERVLKGTTLRLNATVINVGEGTSPPTAVGLYVDGKRLADFPVSSLQPNQSEQVSLLWVPLSLGDHNVSAYADSLRRVSELNESNNYDWFWTTVEGNLNLRLSVEIPRNMLVGESVNITAHITAIDASADNVLVTLNQTYPTTQQIDSQVISHISAGETVDINLTYTPPGPGGKALRVEVNPDRTITETRYDDNIASRWVYAGYPDLIAKLRISDVVIVNESTTIRYGVYNSGRFNTGNETVTLYIDDGINNISIQNNIPSLRPYGGMWLEYEWTPSQLGTYTITVVVSADNTSDQNLRNNVYFKSVDVREYELFAYEMAYPYEVYEDRGFYITVRFNSTAPAVVDATLYAPEGLHVYSPTKEVYTWGGNWNSIWWYVRADEAGTYNVSAVISAYNKTTTIASNQSWGPSPWGVV